MRSVFLTTLKDSAIKPNPEELEKRLSDWSDVYGEETGTPNVRDTIGKRRVKHVPYKSM